MIDELKAHPVPYIALVVATVLAIGFFFGFWPNRVLQRIVAVSYAGFYICWGISTHLHAKKITKTIIFEYLGVGLLGGAMLLLLTL